MQDQLILTDTQRSDFETFKHRIMRKTGIDLNLYKPQQMHRRLMGLVERANLKTFTEYVNLLEHNTAEMNIFLDRLTINVSELFRNPEKWDELRDKILPALLHRRRVLRIWSAGCSFGAEPYSLAMLLDHITPGVRHYIAASDIDRNILNKAREGIYSEVDIKNIPQSYRQKYLTVSGKNYQVSSTLRERITFKQHNLLSDQFERDFDLIVCRNVVIYFTDDAKDHLFSRFASSLMPSGVLFIGGTERIFNYREIGLNTHLPFFYQKI